MQELEARFTAPNACLANLLCDAHDLDRAAFTVMNEDFSFAQMTCGALPERFDALRPAWQPSVCQPATRWQR